MEHRLCPQETHRLVGEADNILMQCSKSNENFMCKVLQKFQRIHQWKWEGDMEVFLGDMVLKQSQRMLARQKGGGLTFQAERKTMSNAL